MKHIKNIISPVVTTAIKDNIKSSWIEFELNYWEERKTKIMYIDLLNDGFELSYNKINCDIANEEIELAKKREV